MTTTNQQIIADLTRAKAVFQLRGIVAAMGINPVAIARNGRPELCIFISKEG